MPLSSEGQGGLGITFLILSKSILLIIMIRNYSAG